MLLTLNVAFQFTDDKTKPSIRLEMVGWKGKKSVRAYVPKNDRIHYLRLVGGDTSKFEINKFQDRRDKNASKASGDADKPDIKSDPDPDVKNDPDTDIKGDLDADLEL